MKRSVLFWSLMCLATICTWAKEMTVQITDTKDLPVPGIKISIPGYSSDGAGNYVTDADGKFVVNRSSLDFLEMYVEDVRGSYELVWNGSNDPVIVKLEGYYWLTMVLKDLNPDQYSLITGVNLYADKSSLYNKISLDAKWTDSGTFSFLYKGEQLYWELVGSILGVNSRITIDVTTLSAGKIEINAPLDGKQKMTVAIKDETNALSAGTITATGSSSYELAIPARETDVYLPKDNYNISARVTGRNSHYIPIYQEVVLSDEPTEQTFSYETAKKITVRVLDIDGLPVKDATVSELIPSAIYESGEKTDAKGEVAYIAIAGTYTYRVVALIGAEERSYGYLEGEIVVGNQDMEQIVSFQDKYFRISLDLTPGIFMTDLNLLQVNIAGNNIKYNEQSKLYTDILRKLNNDSYYTYKISYPGMFTKEGNFQVTKHETIPVSFVNYRKVTFASSDEERYALSEIYINETGKQLMYDCSEDREYYLPDGEFEILATITDLTTQESFPGLSKQTFTVSGEDIKVVYALNENDYYLTTISVLDTAGKPMAGASVELTSENKQDIYSTDEKGELKLHLPDGSYKCQALLSSYEPQQQEFIVDGSDVNIKLSFENYKKLTFNVTGDLLKVFDSQYGRVIPIIKVSNYAINYKHDIFLLEGNSTDGCSGYYYLPDGDYVYSLSIFQNSKAINTSGKMVSLNEDKTENISLTSSDFQEIIVNIVDEKGAPWAASSNAQIYICNNMDKEIYSFDAGSDGILTRVYLPCGTYVAKLEHPDTYGYPCISAIGFTVENEPVSVTLVHKESPKSSLTIKVKGMSDYGYCNLIFYQSGIRQNSCGIESYNHEGEKTIELSEGIYTYRTESPKGKEMTGTVTIPADKELVLDYSNYRHLSVYVESEDGQISHNDKVKTTVYQEDKIIYTGGSSLSGMFPAGIYQVRAWCKGYKAVSQTVTIGDEGQNIRIILPKESAGTYSVFFQLGDCNDVNNESGVNNAVVSLKGYGKLPIPASGVVFTDVTAGEIPYTLSAPGYATLTGVVSVSAEKVTNHGYVPVFAILQPAPTGIEETAAASNDFKVWISDDYLYVRNNSSITGSWIMQLVSLDGSLVYSDKQRLDSENRVYIGNLPKGFYLFVLNNGRKQIAYKVIKN